MSQLIRFRRGFWKPWFWSIRIWLIVLILGGCLSPVITRWVCLWQVSDVRLPFNPDAIFDPQVPVEDDAMVHYKNAERMLDRNPIDLEYFDTRRESGVTESEWLQSLDQWFVAHTEILDEFRAGVMKGQVTGATLDDFINGSMLSGSQRARKLARLGWAAAGHYQRQGKDAEVWDWHHATFRLASHIERDGFLLNYLVASAIRSGTYSHVADWARRSAVTVDLLAKARREIRGLTKGKVRLSEVVSAEYCYSRHVFKTDTGCAILFPAPPAPYISETLDIVARRGAMWMFGEPELTMRLSRQLIVNNWDQLDHPCYERRTVLRSRYPRIVSLDLENVRLPGQLSAERLNELLSTRFREAQLKIFPAFFPLGQQNASVDLDQVFRKRELEALAFEIFLAAHEFQRRVGVFPLSLQELVPQYFDSVPLDPTCFERQPVSYVRQSELEATITKNLKQTDLNAGSDDSSLETDVLFRLSVEE